MHHQNSAFLSLTSKALHLRSAKPDKPLARQVLDFVALKERLERSHTRAVARAESAVYRVQVAASGAVTKGDFAGARLAALEALSDLQQPPDASQVWVAATATPLAKTLPRTLATALVSRAPIFCGSSPIMTLMMYKHQLKSV